MEAHDQKEEKEGGTEGTHKDQSWMHNQLAR